MKFLTKREIVILYVTGIQSLIKRAQSSTVHRFPDITQPFVMNFLKIEDLPQKICNLWWENPRRELTVEDVIYPRIILS